jgi:hypothetical protein
MESNAPLYRAVKNPFHARAQDLFFTVASKAREFLLQNCAISATHLAK